MFNLEKAGKEVKRVEMKALFLQTLENISMYKSGLFEMAGYQPRDSGLPYGLYFDELGKKRSNTQNRPRLKVIMPTGNFITVSINKAPEILLKAAQLTKAERELRGRNKDEIFTFISNNHELMLKHWNGEISTMVLFNSFQK